MVVRLEGPRGAEPCTRRLALLKRAKCFLRGAGTEFFAVGRNRSTENDILT